MVKEKEVYGLLVLDTKEATFGILRGKNIQVMKNLQSIVPGKAGKGGQSQQRYERVRNGLIHDFYKTISIPPKDSINLKLFYTPDSLSLHTATIEILNNDPSENPFNFVIQGEGTGPTNHPLIISQYYEGNANNKWLEITNSANQRSPENSYYLALYRNDDTKEPIGLKPYRKVLIPPL